MAAHPVAAAVPGASVSRALARAAKDRLFGAWATEDPSWELLAWSGTAPGDE
jgi:hypothetical protein